MLIIIFIKNSSNEFIFINNVSIDMLPINAPIISLYNGVFLLRINDTDSNNSRSNPKFSSSIKSKYIFKLITKNIIKKRHIIMCRFLRISLKFFLQ